MFKEGNEKWRLLFDKTTKPKKIPTPEIFFEHFQKYAEESDNTPWEKVDYRGKDADPVTLKYRKPYSWSGFSNWLFRNGIIRDVEDYQYNYSGHYDEFKEVVKLVGSIISEQKMTGAALGFFNANLIAKTEGLVERKEITGTTTILSLGSGVDPNKQPVTDDDDLM